MLNWRSGGTDRQLSKIADPNRSNGPWARTTTCSNLHIRVGEARGDRQVTEPPVRAGGEEGHPPLHLNQAIERRVDPHPYPPVPRVLPCGVASGRAPWSPVDYWPRVKLRSRRGETGARWSVPRPTLYEFIQSLPVYPHRLLPFLTAGRLTSDPRLS